MARLINPKAIFNYKKLPFWLLILGLMIILGYWTYLDMQRSPVKCPEKIPGTPAFLVLNTLDTSSKKINATFMVPSFKKGEETLELYSVTPTQDPKTTNDELIVRVAPYPAPASGGNTGATPTRNSSWSPINLPYSSRSFFYPFEEYVLNIQVQYTDKNGQDVPINLSIDNRIDETIIIDECGRGYSFNRGMTDPNSFNVVLERHRFVRATTAILYLIALFFLYHIARKEETNKVLTNSLGYIAALWGLRGIIVGSSKLFPTIIDFITLILYIAVFVIVLYRLLFSSKESPKQQA